MRGDYGGGFWYLQWGHRIFGGGGYGLPSEVILPELCYVELLPGLICVENSIFGGGGGMAPQLYLLCWEIVPLMLMLQATLL